MTCFHPRPCYFPPGGGRPHFRDDFVGAYDQQSWRPGFVPCRKCAGCLEADSAAWAMRCVHEAQMHKRNCFLTLTLDQANLERNRYSVRKRDLQLFMKRLRWSYRALSIRFFGCAEYGSKTGRAHYHVILFGFDFDDRVPFGDSHGGHPMYSSKTLDALWGKGLCTVQDVTIETAGYCARYSSKKMDSQLEADERRKRLLPDGTWSVLEPEFLLMSRMPGIGESWFWKYWKDVYQFDADGKLQSAVVFIGGARRCPPAYYDRLLRSMDESVYQKVKTVRRDVTSSLRSIHESTPLRLVVREIVQEAKFCNNRVGRDAV